VASLHGAPANHVLPGDSREKLYRRNFSVPQRWIMILLNIATTMVGVNFQVQMQSHVK